jgi:hypothetical protein
MRTGGIGAIELSSKEKGGQTEGQRGLTGLDCHLAADAPETGPRDVLLLDGTLLPAGALRWRR